MVYQYRPNKGRKICFLTKVKEVLTKKDWKLSSPTKNAKKIIVTIKWQAQHSSAGRNTQQPIYFDVCSQ